MKVSLYILAFIISFSLFPEKTSAQLSTQGTEFWLSYGQNRTYTYGAINLQLRIVAEQTATVTLFYFDGNVTETYNILAGNILTIPFNSTQKNRVFTPGAATSAANKKSLRITSTTPIYVFAMNQANITTDATNLFPVGCLGMDYYHMSYKAASSWHDGYTVVVTQDSTDIFENGVMVANNLQKGYAFHRWPNTTGIGRFRSTDSTGMHITATKPVAYFTTNGGTFINEGLNNGADCLFQQLLPVNTWGTKFMVPVTHRGFVRTRVLASQNNTTITYYGGSIKEDNASAHNKKFYGVTAPYYIINKGQFMEIESLVSQKGTFIEADKPVVVTTYLVGRDETRPPGDQDDLIQTDTKGDPAMTWLPPIEQSIDSTRIAPFIPNGTTAITEHYALVTVLTLYKNDTRVTVNTGSPAPLSGGTWYDHPSGYSFYAIKLTNNSNDSYLFRNPWGLTVLCYGFGNYESYYYLSGAAARKLDLAFYYKNQLTIDSLHHQDLDGRTFCDDSTAHFSALVRYANDTVPGYLKWYIDENEITWAEDQLIWDTTLSEGPHKVKLMALGLEGTWDSVSSTFTIAASQRVTIKDTICLGEQYIYPKTGTPVYDTIPDIANLLIDSVFLKTLHGCDSIIRLELTVLPSYDTLVYDTVCQSNITYDTYGFTGIDISNEGTQILIDTLTTVNYCDSIIILTLTVNPVYDTLVYDTVCQSNITYDTYGFTGIDISNEGTQILIDTLTTVNHCDSIIRLELTVNPVYDTLVYDTVCQSNITYDTYGFTGIDISNVGTQILIDTLTTVNYCDSIIRLELTVNPVYDTLVYDTVCQSNITYDTYGFTGIDISNEGTQILIDTLTTVNHCDSIVILTITVNPVYDTLVYDTVCQSNITYDTYGFTGIDISTVGTQILIDTLTTVNYCDSIIRLELAVLPVYDTLITDTICLGDSYTNSTYPFLDTTPISPNPIIRDTTMYTVIGGCDSIVRFELTILLPFDTVIVDSICLGEQYTKYGFDINATQVGFIQSVQNWSRANGCDSTIYLNLKVYPTYDITINDNICSGENYDANGFELLISVPGTYFYQHNFKTTECNCDSIITLYLTVNPVYNEYLSGTIYEDEFYNIGNYQYNTPGLHISNLQTIEGCDSIITLNLNVIYYPTETAFTPGNKDGTNDYFMSGFKIQIFNRYGALIYETRTPEEQALGWDGRNSKGHEVEPGLYFYVLYNSNGKPRLKSTVEVLKR
ncbi:MAG: gliding motility-associated C-terminal domain-containing protein [Prevotellaceae bacterium]|jgi:hypothetical protein|nr:gliding motility-associated C-terminal domain-containing protein [Prevotellaceae bacterium]